MKVGLRDAFFVGVVASGALAMGAGLLRTQATSAPQPVVTKTLKSDLEPIVKSHRRFVSKAMDRRRACSRPKTPATSRSCGGCRSRCAARCRRWKRFAASRRGRKTTRVTEWLDDLLRDRRCTDYLAERFARVYVGTEDGPFILYRRRRFIAWLSDALLENRPYDSLVTEMIADKGLWTDQPATNFVTVTLTLT